MPRVVHDGLRKRCRCSRRAWVKCRHPWQFSFHHKGRGYRCSLDAVARQRGERPPTSKTEAIAWRDRLRAEIRAGRSIPALAPRPDTCLSVADIATVYQKQHIERHGRRPNGLRLMIWYLQGALKAEVPAPAGTTVKLGQKLITSVTTADVEAIREGWRRRDTGSQSGRIGADRVLKRLRHFFNWAIEKGYTDQTPFRRHGVALVHFGRERGRTRRLEPGEEAALLKHAPPLLHALIVAALETGMRKGELLQLRWRDVQWAHDALLLPAAITKTDTARDVPMTQRLRAVLELRRHAPDGTEQPGHALVFGNETGEEAANIRDAWTATCRAAEITGLHFHDLRREFASRLRETPGVTDHHVRDWLGHADLATTSRYLATTRAGLQMARRAFERRTPGSSAHDLHTEAPAEPTAPPEHPSEIDAKSLN